VEGSTAAARVEKEIATLRRERVLSRTRFETRDLAVTTNEPQEIILRQVVDVFPRFVSESGEDLTGEQGPQRQVTLWTLQLEAAEWQIAKAVVVQTHPLRDDRAS
jgi:hypothetical protein